MDIGTFIIIAAAVLVFVNGKAGCLMLVIAGIWHVGIDTVIERSGTFMDKAYDVGLAVIQAALEAANL